MTNAEPPFLPRSLHPVWDWVESIDERRETPTGFPIRHVSVHVGSAEEAITFLYPVDPYTAGVVVSGELPRFLHHAESGVAVFRLTAPCVVFSWYHRPRQKLSGTAIMVVHRPPDLKPAGKHQPHPALMQALRSLIHRPQRQQEQAGQPPNPDPTPDAEGRDPDGSR